MNRRQVAQFLSLVCVSLLLASCSLLDPDLPEGAVRWDGLEIRTEVKIDGFANQLVAETTLRNVTPRSVTIPHGACAITLYAYDNPERSGKPVWNSNQRSPRLACIEILIMMRLKPGERGSSAGFNLRIPLHEIVFPDNLAEGPFYFTAVLRFLDENTSRSVLTPEIPAGSAFISHGSVD